MARPMPRPAPVTIATLPSTCPAMVSCPFFVLILRRPRSGRLEGWLQTSAPWPSFETRGFAALLRMRSTPHLVRQRDDHPELGPLLVLAQQVALLGRGKAALRREAELVRSDVFCGLVDAALQG